MEYIFGTVYEDGTEYRNLKTRDSMPTNLTGYCHIERHYPDCIITDDFKIIKKYQSAKVEQGVYLDWYIIDEYNRMIDKFSPIKEQIENNISQSQDALCIFSIDVEERLAEIEDALCEMSKEVE